jgi:hypothetical protein
LDVIESDSVDSLIAAEVALLAGSFVNAEQQIFILNSLLRVVVV